MNLKARQQYRKIMLEMQDMFVAQMGVVKIYIEKGKLKARANRAKPVVGILAVVDLVGTYNNYTVNEANNAVEWAVRRVINGRANQS